LEKPAEALFSPPQNYLLLMKLYITLTTALFLCASLTVFAQDKPAYKLFDAKGKTAKYQKLAKEAQQADVIFFGELHNNPIAHWLQLELCRDLYEAVSDKLALGAEMFEADNQAPLDDYLAGRIDDKAFGEQARLWNNYKTDYKPLVELAREKGLPFTATNVPRKYASLVFRQGLEALDTLPAEAKAHLAPLPIPFDINLPGYQKMMEMMAGHGGGASENFPKAQAIKDATMAHFIHQNWQTGQTFIHFNGAYHSDNYEGIIWYLNQYRPGLRILTITTVEQESLDKLEAEHRGKADFIIAVPEAMTKTY
jgi:uncharacterized iron-regulated protein